ncbi:MAG: hypothetical protein J0I09_04770 [Sphingobacteriia bacterium]|nr:hypothetical protein [Sphingobacteriia bacterium]
MKKILIAAVLLFSIVAKSQTADEVLMKFEDAVGGRTLLQKLITLQYKSVITLRMMGSPIDITVNNYRENKKLYRREVQGMMGMRNSYSLLTDTAGYLYIPPMRGFGGGGFGGGGGDRGNFGGGGFGGGDVQQSPLTKMTDAQLAEQTYQLDLDGPFGHLVNYTAKGHKAELLGTGKVNKQDCYKIKFTLKSGQEMTYYISTATYYIVKLECIGKVAIQQFGIGPLLEQMGSNANKMKVDILFSNYDDIGNGIKFPMKEKLEVGAAEIDLANSDFINNVEIDTKYYRNRN